MDILSLINSHLLCPWMATMALHDARGLLQWSYIMPIGCYNITTYWQLRSWPELTRCSQSVTGSAECWPQDSKL